MERLCEAALIDVFFFNHPACSPFTGCSPPIVKPLLGVYGRCCLKHMFELNTIDTFVPKIDTLVPKTVLVVFVFFMCFLIA